MSYGKRFLINLTLRRRSCICDSYVVAQAVVFNCLILRNFILSVCIKQGNQTLECFRAINIFNLNK